MCNCDYVFLLLYVLFSTDGKLVAQYFVAHGCLSQQVQWQTVISGVCCTHVAPGALCELICTLLSPIDLDRKSVSNGLCCKTTRDALLQVQMCFPLEAQIMLKRKVVYMCR